MTLIAEDLLLLLLDDDSGRLSGTSYPATVLGGALLVELALTGAVDVGAKQGFWRTAKVEARGTLPADPLLRSSYDVVAEKPRSAQDLVNRLGKGARDTLADRLVERGMLERVDGKVLGLFPTTRWPAADSAHEEEVRRALAIVLVKGEQPDDRTGALVALLHAIDKAHKMVDGPRGEVRKRAKTIAQGDWAAQAVRDAIQASTAAVTAGVAASTAAVASSG